jgi:hypothetical protein
MIDITKYKWFLYQGRPIHLVTDHPEFDLEMEEGNKFAYRKIGANHYLVSRGDLDIRFKIKEKDAKRVIANSRGWKGTIRGVKVVNGAGGLDKPKKSDDPNIFTLHIDSSNLAQAWLEKKEKLLHVVFHSGVHWAYENVSLALAKQLESAESQGQFFIYRIREVKKAYKVN